MERRRSGPLPPWAHEETHVHFKSAMRGSPHAIVAAFDWNKAPGGAEFWREVYREASTKGYISGPARIHLEAMARELRVDAN